MGFAKNTNNLSLSNEQLFTSGGVDTICIGASAYPGATGQLVPVPGLRALAATLILLRVHYYRERRVR